MEIATNPKHNPKTCGFWITMILESDGSSLQRQWPKRQMPRPHLSIVRTKGDLNIGHFGPRGTPRARPRARAVATGWAGEAATAVRRRRMAATGGGGSAVGASKREGDREGGGEGGGSEGGMEQSVPSPSGKLVSCWQ